MRAGTRTTTLVTGAGGFVGSAIVRRLVRSDACFWDGARVEHVVALLRPGGSDTRLAELADDAGWSAAHADVTDPEALRSLLEDVAPRAVVHAALDTGAYRDVDERLVLEPLETLLRVLGRSVDSRLLHVGSAWVLAAGESLSEEARLDPSTPYARNKAAEDIALPRLAEEHGVRWINLRLFNVFGRYENPERLLPSIVAALSRGDHVQLTHGEQVRDFSDVDDAAAAFVHAIAAPERAWQALYHVGSGRGTTVRAFALQVAALAGDAKLLRFGARGSQDENLDRLVADPSRVGDALGWQPDTDLEARIRDAVDWWLPRLADRPGQEIRA